MIGLFSHKRGEIIWDYICNKNIKCADCEHYRRNPDEDRMFCYAEVDEKAEEAKNKAAKAAYVAGEPHTPTRISVSSTLFPFWQNGVLLFG